MLYMPSDISGAEFGRGDFLIRLRYSRTPANLPDKCDGCGAKTEPLISTGSRCKSPKTKQDKTDKSLDPTDNQERGGVLVRSLWKNDIDCIIDVRTMDLNGDGPRGRARALAVGTFTPKTLVLPESPYFLLQMSLLVLY